MLIAIISLLVWGLQFGIDFTGGTDLIYKTTSVEASHIANYLSTNYKGSSITNIATGTYQVQTEPLSEKTITTLESTLTKDFKLKKPEQVTTIGPSIGIQLQQVAIYSIIIVMLGIIFYITYSFRAVPKPANSFAFGGAAIIAMIHDVLIVFGAFSILGHFFNAPVDSLFVTAVLTVMGFSVHDTIVVFDRIRENLIKKRSNDFSYVINFSLMQTLNRSLNTSFTVILVLVALFLVGGITIRWFVIALLIGVTAGTYSSIFVASQLLVIYAEHRKLQ